MASTRAAESPAPTRRACTVRGRRRLPLALLAVAVLTFGHTGCVFRRMTIRSDPPGALVLLDGEEVGYTPFSGDFTYYATPEITLIKDGYETLTTFQTIPAPWYQKVPLDFFSDNLLPFKVTDRHDFTYRLQPQVVVPTEELLDRAKSLRSELQIGP